MKQLILIFLVTLFQFPVFSQQPRTVEEPYFGIEFTAPQGWNYQRTEIGYIFGHNTIPGLIIMMANDFKTVQEMESAAYQGLQDEYGTYLMPQNKIIPFGNNGRAGDFEGLLEGQKVSAYMIGLVSSTNGKGVTLLAAASPTIFDESQVTAIESLAKSVKFTKMESPPVVDEWRKALKVQGGSRLTYMNTYTSNDYDGGMSGYSDETIIDLCPQGFFRFSDHSDSSFDTQGGFGYTNSDNQGNGTWALETDGTNAVLVLNFNDGRRFDYTITYENEETHLNGNRYFLTYADSSTGRPECN